MKYFLYVILVVVYSLGSRLKQSGVMKGDHLDGRYNMINIYNPESKKPMTILWEAQDMENDNKLVIMKFYLKYTD
jgi:hypothetical protein